MTVYEAVDLHKELGLKYIELFVKQRVSPQAGDATLFTLNAGQRAALKAKLAEAGIVSVHMKDIKAEGGVWGQGPNSTARAVFEELHRQGWKGLMAMEEGPGAVEEKAQCFAFVEKTAAELIGKGPPSNEKAQGEKAPNTGKAEKRQS